TGSAGSNETRESSRTRSARHATSLARHSEECLARRKGDLHESTSYQSRKRAMVGCLWWRNGGADCLGSKNYQHVAADHGLHNSKSMDITPRSALFAFSVVGYLLP